ncbi:hypothetical protein [Romboutsia ilealis]|uniref:hypothetical protein n=1 Tax=Romboutsia ilealis TaxID=1115758 RepID=UPI00272D4D43|nr:hypothetical protein [Romboutsia ilealis]
MINEFATRDEIIFIEYDDIIKSTNTALLKLLKNDYKDDIKDFIHFEKVEQLEDNKIDLFSTARIEKNILKALSKINFDYDYVFKTLVDSKIDLYAQMQPLMFADAIHALLPQKFTKEIYIYSEEYDSRIECDIAILFKGSSKINYITGDFSAVIDSIPNITLYVLSDIDKLGKIIQLNRQEYCEFMIAEYGYNYYEDNGIVRLKGNYEEIQEDKIFKIGTFSPISI